MESTGVGGGIMLAFAAVLWMAYLVPIWFKRREYLSTERNAVRLQQTIRVLAETAEMPDVVRAGMKPARAPVEPGSRAPAPRASRAHRLRRTRAATSLILLGCVVTLVAQGWLIVAVGAVPGSWLVVALSVTFSFLSIAMLNRLARVGRSSAVRAAPARRSSLEFADPEFEVSRAEWTPVPVPKPLYLSREARPTAVARDPMLELQAAAAAAERALRLAEREVTPISRPAASRFATMGIVTAPTFSPPDLDEVLRRRRAAG